MNGIRLAMAILEQQAQHHEQVSIDALANGQSVKALIADVVAAEFRKAATQVEHAWQEERERDA